MAAKKKRANAISKSKRVISAKTKVKLSQAAKRRGRMHGRFSKGSFAAEGPRNKGIRKGPGTGRPGEARPPKGSVRGGAPELGSKGRKSGMSNTEFKGALQDEVNRRIAKGQSPSDARADARLALYAKEGQMAGPHDFDHPALTVRHADLGQVTAARRSSNWKTGQGLYTTRYGQTGKRRDALNLSEMTGQMAPEHRKEFEKLLKDPSSNFNRGIDVNQPHSGRAKYSHSRHRQERYALNLQRGMSHEEAYRELSTETRGRSPSGPVAKKAGATGTPYSIASKQSERETGTRDNTNNFRTSRFQKQAKSETGRGFGVDIPAADSIATLADRFPDRSGKDLVRMQQAQKETYYDQFTKNNRWAHETKRANIISGSDKGGQVSQSNKVTFFTTSLGSPTASVPADSLVGQYIIRKRKKVLKQEGWDSRSLQGSFPNAVRDMHIAEASAGRSLGVEGDVGVYKQGGWRAGNKRSQGFGKRAPVGASVMTDSQGRAMYDRQGNVVYSPGAERKFRFGTDRQLGFRVFLG